MNYYTIPCKAMDIPMTVHITSEAFPEALEPILSSQFFSNMSSISAQFNIHHLIKQHNLSDVDVVALTKINNSHGFIQDVLCPSFIVSHGKNGVVPIAMFSYIEVLSTCDILRSLREPTHPLREPTQSTQSSQSVQPMPCVIYMGNNSTSFKTTLRCMVPSVPVDLEIVPQSEMNHDTDWVHQVHGPGAALIYIDICADTPIISHQYTVFLMKVVCLILARQLRGGSVAIKVNTLYFKPILDMMYILSGKYANMYIVHPFVADPPDNRVVVFSHMLSPSPHVESMISAIPATVDVGSIYSVSDVEMSHYFANKVEECNMLIGQKCVDQCDAFMMLIKNSAKEMGNDVAKKCAIAKCVQWCEKHHLPIAPPIIPTGGQTA